MFRRFCICAAVRWMEVRFGEWMLVQFDRWTCRRSQWKRGEHANLDLQLFWRVSWERRQSKVLSTERAKEQNWPSMYQIVNDLEDYIVGLLMNFQKHAWDTQFCVYEIYRIKWADYLIMCCDAIKNCVTRCWFYEKRQRSFILLFFVSIVHCAKVGEILHYSAASHICGKHISVKKKRTKAINSSFERLWLQLLLNV